MQPLKYLEGFIFILLVAHVLNGRSHTTYTVHVIDELFLESILLK